MLAGPNIVMSGQTTSLIFKGPENVKENGSCSSKAPKLVPDIDIVFTFQYRAMACSSENGP